MTHSVSVVIPNYNGRELLEENIPSVIKALYLAKAEYEIIIPDDASTDDSIEFINQKYPSIKIIPSQKNGGFSINTNKGIFSATKSLVLLLNTDIKLKEDYLIHLWKYFDKSDTFGVMGSSYSYDGKKILDAAKFPLWKAWQLNSTTNYSPKDILNSKLPTLFLSGANALIDRKKLLALSGFDERYSPFYMEDVDLSVRALRTGWKCYYESQAICYHKLSETISKLNNKSKIKNISRRNKFIFHDTHLEGAKRVLWQVETLSNLLSRWFILDKDYYKSFAEYKHIIEQSQKQNFSKSLETVVKELLAQIKSIPIELF